MGIAKKPEANRGKHPGQEELRRELKTGDMKRLTVDLDSRLYKRLRVHAAERETTIATIVREELARALKKEEAE